MSQPDYSVPPILTQEESVRVALHVWEDSSLHLVRLIQQEIDKEANFRSLFDLHRSRVQNFFRRKGFAPQEASDLTHDVFLRVFKGIDTFRGESTFEWWLKEVAESVYKNELRRRGADKRDGIEQSPDARPVSDDDPSRPLLELVSPDAGPLAQAERQEQVRRIQTALEALPPQMRQCCLLRYQNGLKYQEIATIMRISVETVKAHLFQARKRLVGELAGQEVHTGEPDQIRAGSRHLPAGEREGQEDPLPEEVLTAQIRRPLPDFPRARYQELMDKRRSETLSPREYEELVRLTDEVEKAEAGRARSLLELARLKGLSVDQLLADLNIQAS